MDRGLQGNDKIEEAIRELQEAPSDEQLAHTLMPVGEYTKDEIRVLAEEAGLPVAHKPDSQETAEDGLRHLLLLRKK